MIKVSKFRTVYIVVGVVVMLLLAWALLRESPVSVETAISSRGRMRVTVDGEGKTRARIKNTITAPVAGRMTRIRLTEGDRIPHDFPITEIDPNPPVQRVPNQFDDRPNIYAAKVFAPMAGTVLRIFQKSEGYVSAGTPLVELGDPDNIEIVVEILSTEALKIPPGAPMILANEESTEPVNARVQLIEPQATTKVSALGVEEQRVNVIGAFLTKAPKYGDNFRVDVKIVVWEEEDVLTIPSSALFRNGGDWNVFVIEAGRARRRVIKADHQNAESTQILEGVSEGEVVILHPSSQLEDGVKVSSR